MYKIDVVTPTDSKNVKGGLEKFAEEMIDHLEKRGFFVNRIFPPNSLFGYKGYHKIYLPKLANISISDKGYAVVFGSVSLFALSFTLFSLVSRRKILYIPLWHDPILHDSGIRYKLSFKTALKIIWDKVATEFMAFNSDSIGVLSKFESCRFMAYSSKCFQIRPPLSNQFFDIQCSEITSTRDFDVAFVGRIGVNKGVDKFISLARMDYKKSYLIITPYIDNNLLRDLPGNIIIVTNSSNDEVVSYLLRVKVFLCPSSYESYSISCMEALMAGCTVIASSYVMGKSTFEKYEKFLISDFSDLETCFRLIDFHCENFKNISDSSHRIMKSENAPEYCFSELDRILCMG